MEKFLFHLQRAQNLQRIGQVSATMACQNACANPCRTRGYRRRPYRDSKYPVCQQPLCHLHCNLWITYKDRYNMCARLKGVEAHLL